MKKSTKEATKEIKKETSEVTLKKTHRPLETERDLIIRLNRIEGQIRGLKNMVERGDYCIDIMVQASAANAALNSFSKQILAAHIQTCIVEDVKNGNMEKVNELADIIKRVLR